MEIKKADSFIYETASSESLIEDWHDEDKDSDISVFKKSDSYYSSNKRNAVEIVLTEKRKVEPEPITQFIPNPIYTAETQPPTSQTTRRATRTGGGSSRSLCASPASIGSGSRAGSSSGMTSGWSISG